METTIDVRPESAKQVSVGSSVVVGLAVAVFVLATIAALSGLLSGGQGPDTAVNVYGESVTLHGEGLYRHDTVFRAGANLGTDVLTLVLGLPFLAATTVMYRRGSAIGAVLLSGAFAYFLYLYSTMSLATAYNEMFLVYVALFGTSLFGLALTIRSIDAERIDTLIGGAAPRRALAILMVASGVVTAGVWLLPLVGALAAGEPPKLLDTSTTMVTDALDLAIITPSTLLAGVLLLRRRPEGWLIAFPQSEHAEQKLAMALLDHHLRRLTCGSDKLLLLHFGKTLESLFQSFNGRITEL